MSKNIIVLACLFLSFAAHAENKGLVCGGTEPFFSLNIDAVEGKLKYTSPENLTGTTYAVAGPLDAAGLPEGNAFVFQGEGVSAALLSSSIAGADCSDGMSDNKYAYHLIFTSGDGVKYGCCEPKAQD